MYRLFNNIQSNTKNKITFFHSKQRAEKSFKDLDNDILFSMERIKWLSENTHKIQTIGLIGPISYFWMVLDLSCIKSGILTIAIPENLPLEKIKQIISEENCDLILVDGSYREELKLMNGQNIFFFNVSKESEKCFNCLPSIYTDPKEGNVLERYSITYSSGTSANIKRIICTFNEDERNKSVVRNKDRGLILLKNIISNKILIFMPFSHSQQREFVYKALRNNIDIVLSDPTNCIKHLILEKPNIMVSVPSIYEALSDRIDLKIRNFHFFRKSAHILFNLLKINTLSNRNIIKSVSSRLIYGDIRKLYGGRADYFVSGSAPISHKALRIFYSIGVRIIEAYGQSESDTIAINDHRKFKIGSVGIPKVELKISSDSEILIKYHEDRHKNNLAALSLSKDGFIKTGDIGELDKDGYLFLKGRIDDVLVLENGKKVYPFAMEEELKERKEIKESIIFLTRDKEITALVFVNKVYSEDGILGIVRRVNENRSSYEKIRRVIVSSIDLGKEDSLMTANQKIIRKAVIEKFQDVKSVTV